jgi:predicted nuclease of predicted toxin-antitoxin system
MRILFDHCMPSTIRRLLIGHHVRTSRQMGWDRLRNGLLLDAAQANGFEVLLTVDRSMQFQQNMTGRTISIVVMAVRNNRPPTVAALIPDFLALLPTIQPGQIYLVPVPLPPPPLPPPTP